MEYRINQRTGDRISVIGIGSGYITEAPEKEAMEALELAYENGINYVDTVASSAEGYGLYGKAFEKVRDKMIYQVHFGAEYSTGKYGWTTDAEMISLPRTIMTIWKNMLRIVYSADTAAIAARSKWIR
ncbi:hypothetical protein B5F29_09280 [Lachnoclostridium sp. An196]|nr:aldo/keto reductase [Lachnoclostridium sp. An196]OUP18983.1 hypothetical protein B5F29_09280 [Lachnoclostridium sp. An196]